MAKGGQTKLLSLQDGIYLFQLDRPLQKKQRAYADICSELIELYRETRYRAKLDSLKYRVGLSRNHPVYDTISLGSL